MHNIHQKLKTIIAIFVLVLLSSCYTDDYHGHYQPYYPQTISPTPCYEFIAYNFYTYYAATDYVHVYYNISCPYSQFYDLYIEHPQGSFIINGKRWLLIPNTIGPYDVSPIVVRVDYYYLYPNVSYRCIIRGSASSVSQEFIITL